MIKSNILGVHELRQRTFEPLLKKLAHEIWIAMWDLVGKHKGFQTKNIYSILCPLFLTTALNLAENKAQATRIVSYGMAAYFSTSFALRA